ncbi:MAG: HEAT repeat domain-containing protein [Geitlerinemataceae cyanobacterium]
MTTSGTEAALELARAIAAVDAADSSLGMLRAVAALAQTRSTGAIVKLIEVLRYNNPGAAVAAVEGLVAIGEPSVLPLLELMDGYNYGARAWAMRALSQIGDPRGLSVLLEALVDFSLSVRRAAAKGLGSLLWEAVEPGQLDGMRGQILEALSQSLCDDEWVVRYASVVGLEGLAMGTIEFASAPGTELRDRVAIALQKVATADSEVAVSTRATLAVRNLAEAG